MIQHPIASELVLVESNKERRGNGHAESKPAGLYVCMQGRVCCLCPSLTEHWASQCSFLTG